MENRKYRAIQVDCPLGGGRLMRGSGTDVPVQSPDGLTSSDVLSDTRTYPTRFTCPRSFS